MADPTGTGKSGSQRPISAISHRLILRLSHSAPRGRNTSGMSSPAAVFYPSRSARPGLLALLGLIALVAGGKAVLFDTLDPDCFWHLRVAEQLKTEGVRPLVDRMSFASVQTP